MKLDTNKALKSVKYNNVDVPLASGGLNVFVQETQPTAQNGLWIKRAKNAVAGVEIDNAIRGINFSDVVLPGNFDGLPVDPNYQNVNYIRTIKIGSILYASPSKIGTSWSRNYLKYDIETGVFSRGTFSYPSGTTSLITWAGDFEVVNNAGIFFQNGLAWKIDYEAEALTKLTTTSAPGLASHTALGTGIYGNIIYCCWGRDGQYGALTAFDLETNVVTKLYSNIPTTKYDHYGKLYRVGEKLHYFVGNLHDFYYDLSTSSLVEVGAYVTNSPQKKRNYFPPYGMITIGTTIYFLGLTTSETAPVGSPANSVYYYDIVTGETGKIDTTLGSELQVTVCNDNFSVPGWYFDGSTVFMVGGVYYESGGYKYYKKALKIIITSNDLPTGTVWAHESTSENVTEMYKDKTMTLKLGIDKVLIQEADGLKVQPAAIIKNGVATDIGGGVTPEPGPTPTLEGTWVLNERLYAPESAFSAVVDYTANFTSTGNSAWKSVSVSNILSFNKNADETGGYTMYRFETNAWDNVRAGAVKSITFNTGATASDDFITWLVANATKQ